MTPAQLAACLFVKTQADEIDKASGRSPAKETQKRVAEEVRATFLSEEANDLPRYHQEHRQDWRE